VNQVRIKHLANNPVDKVCDSGNSYIGLEHLESGTGKLTVSELPTNQVDDSITHLPGDVLFGTLRPYLSKSYLATGFGVGSSELLVLRPGAGLDPRFLLYLTLSSPWVEWANATSYGSKMPRTSWEGLSEFSTWTPPLDEQRRIADFLDAETARINRLTEIRTYQLNALRERYTLELSERVTPGISAHINRHSHWPWLPENIDTARLGYFANVQNGITVDASRTKSGDEKEFPYLRVGNVQGEDIDLSELKHIHIEPTMARRSMLLPGDIVMTEANGNPDNLGRGAVWRGQVPSMVHQNHIFAIRMQDERLLSDYLSIVLASIHGRRYFRFTSTQVGIATTTSNKVRSLPVPVASRQVQHNVVNYCTQLRESTEAAEQALNRQINLLTERRQALITAAVTGQLDVTTARGADVA